MKPETSCITVLVKEWKDDQVGEQRRHVDTEIILHAIFYAAILAGLIWQITEISVNFFKYETVSVVNVIMPEDDNVTKYFNLCVVNFQVADHSALSDYLKEKKIVLRSKDLETFFVYNLTLRERFKLTKKFTPDPGFFNG